MIIAGVNSARGGGVALICGDRLTLGATGDVDDARVLRQLLANSGHTPVDVDEWAQPGTPASQGVGLASATAVAYPRSECRLAAAWCTSPFAASGERATVVVWDTDAAALAYAVDADGRYARIDAEPFDTVPELGDRLRTAGDGGPMNLCLTGDRALDVTLSSAIRTLPEVKALWVPPFPDVTGDAAGAAALHLAHCRTRAATDAGDPADPVLPGLAWRLRSGTVPARPVHVPAGWTVSPCRPEELARMLVRGGRPVVFINGPAKLGPYALGSRSILAPATSGDARARLGALRGDPTGTTVTALCLERDVPDVFAPGIPDPYVRFEHRLRDEWADRLPGLADGGPGPLRVQTVSMDDDPTLSTVVREYHKWSGIPALCATDAVPADTGPLADVAAALSWGGLDLVWSDNILYRANRQEPPR